MITIPPGDRGYFGQSYMGREGDDLVISVLVGHLSEADSAVLYAERDRLIAGLSYFLDLVDVREFNSVALGARKYVLKQGLNAPTRGIALVGGSFHARALLSMIMRGLQLF